MAPGEEGGGVATGQLEPAASTPTAAGTPTAPASGHLGWASVAQAALYAGGTTVSEVPPTFYTPSSSYSSPSPYVCGAQMATVAIRETETKPLEGSDQDLKKASGDTLGNHGPVTGNFGDGIQAISISVNVGPLDENCGDCDKASFYSIDGVHSHSHGSRHEVSLENSRDDEASPYDSSKSGKRIYDQLLPASVKVASSLPVNSLSSGMKPGISSHAVAANMKERHDTVGVLPAAPITVTGPNKGVPENQRMQNEHDERRQKRKLSNRESARRSRERKQKECEDLARQVAELHAQNSNFRTEIDKLNAECKNLDAENASIVEELKQLYGPGVLAAIGREKIFMPPFQVVNSEGNGHFPEGNNLVPIGLPQHNVVIDTERQSLKTYAFLSADT